MSRTLGITFAWIAVSLSTISSAQDRPSPIPDPDWRPKAGDRVVVHLPDSPALPDLASCQRYIKFSRAGDAAGIREVAGKPGVVKLAAGTPVLVVQPHGLPTPRIGNVVMSPEQFHAETQEELLRSAARPTPVVSIEARILDGPLKDSLRFIPMESLARMIPAPATSTLKVGDRVVVAARSVPMGDDHDYLLQFIRDPDGGDNRAHVLPLSRGTTLVIQSVGQWSFRVKVTGRSKYAGKVGYVKGEGLDVVKAEASKTKKR